MTHVVTYRVLLREDAERELTSAASSSRPRAGPST
jgi:hypothetical protein